MVCYEGNGVPVDIKMLNRKADIERGVDPLITRALEVLREPSFELLTVCLTGPHGVVRLEC
jgi:hypothetical protein